MRVRVHHPYLKCFVITLVSMACLAGMALAQEPSEALWQDLESGDFRAVDRQLPDSYRALELDLESLGTLLSTAPLEGSVEATTVGQSVETILSLPLPKGGFSRFRVVESPIMEPGLAAKFPEIKTYRGEGIDDPRATVRFDLTPAGFHAMVLAPRGRVFIDPEARGVTDRYLSYYARDARRSGELPRCDVEGHDEHPLPSPGVMEHGFRGADKGSGDVQLRTYRLVVAATGEYTQFHGGTVPLGQAAIVTAMNRVNGIYESELAIRMVLVANNDLVVYTDGGTDPYTNSSGGALLGENTTNLNSVIGSANYDIGHVFSTGGGGVATLNGPCGGNKARGVTGLPSPTGDPFWVDFVAHEMGHQWGGTHTFNGDTGSCAGGNRTASTAYEPGSGTTIQAYAGICGAQNIQLNSDPYFHGVSLDQIIAFSRSGNGNTCAATSATGNDNPTADAGMSYTIPLNTPFELCGGGTDPNSDPLTFAWEQFDLGAAGAPNSPVGDAPIFRSFNPTASPCRTFPQVSDLVNNTQTLGELLPTYARTMTFRLTARDNQSGGGGIGDDTTTVTVTDSAGPFQITSPNTNLSVGGGETLDVAWDVASTDQAPVNCTSVDISYSTDGGLTFPMSLAAGVPNDGSEAVTIPMGDTSTARVQVRCSNNIFFDISDVNFGVGVPSLNITAPADGSIVTDGDTVTFTATATDPEDGNLAASVEWTSSIDGALGTGGTLQTSSLSLGTHTITAAVQDSGMNMASDTITVFVQPPCSVEIYTSDFEADDGGWVDGVSTCTTGTFIRGTPDEVVDGTVTQVAGASEGTFAWFTQNNAGGVGTDDVDGGTCETLSPVIPVEAGSTVVAFVDYFHGQRDGGDDAEDGFTIELIDGSSGVVLDTLVDIGDVTNIAAWTPEWGLAAEAPASVRLRIRATDGTGGGDLVEGGVDAVRICNAYQLFYDGFESGTTGAWVAVGATR